MKKKYDVITISHYFYPRVGGLEAIAFELSSMLGRSNFSTLSIYGGNSHSHNNFSHFDNIQIKLLALFRGSYPIPGVRFIMTLLFQFLRNKNATIVVHDRHLLTSVAAALVAKVIGREYVLVSHTTISNYFESKTLEKIGSLLEKYIFSNVVRGAREVIAVSKTNKDYLVENLAAEPGKVRVIHNGFSDRYLSMYKIQPKQKIAVFATKWIPVKDPDTTAKAFVNLAKKYSDWRFYFVGEGDCFLKDETNRPQNLIVENRFYSKSELFNLLSKSFIYVNSSINEGLSVGVLEAAALGNRLVLSDAPSNVELAGELKQLGQIFSREDTESLEKSLEKIMAKFERNSKATELISKRTYQKFSDRVLLEEYIPVVLDNWQTKETTKPNLFVK